MSKVIEPSTHLSESDKEYIAARPWLNIEDYDLTSEDFEDATEIPPYSEWNVPTLEKEIDERNEERGEDAENLIVVPPKARKADLIALLEADDEANADTDDDSEA